MTNEELKDIEARASAATPGPWKRRGSLSLDSCVESEAFDHRDVPAVTIDIDGERAREDADFIAAARSDVPALCAAQRERDAALRGRDATIARLRGIIASAHRTMTDDGDNAAEARAILGAEVPQ